MNIGTSVIQDMLFPVVRAHIRSGKVDEAKRTNLIYWLLETLHIIQLFLNKHGSI